MIKGFYDISLGSDERLVEWYNRLDLINAKGVEIVEKIKNYNKREVFCFCHTFVRSLGDTIHDYILLDKFIHNLQVSFIETLVINSDKDPINPHIKDVDLYRVRDLREVEKTAKLFSEFIKDISTRELSMIYLTSSIVELLYSKFGLRERVVLLIELLGLSMFSLDKDRKCQVQSDWIYFIKNWNKAL